MLVKAQTPKDDLVGGPFCGTIILRNFTPFAGRLENRCNYLMVAFPAGHGLQSAGKRLNSRIATHISRNLYSLFAAWSSSWPDRAKKEFMAEIDPAFAKLRFPYLPLARWQRLFIPLANGVTLSVVRWISYGLYVFSHIGRQQQQLAIAFGCYLFLQTLVCLEFALVFTNWISTCFLRPPCLRGLFFGFWLHAECRLLSTKCWQIWKPLSCRNFKFNDLPS